MKKDISIVLFIVLILLSCGKNSKRVPVIHSSKKNHLVEDNQKAKNNKAVVYMKKLNGVYIVPVQINGFELDFVFDTGASDITISSLEAAMLIKQDRLSEADILGETQYRVADGSIINGTIINLRSVKIANKELCNIKASIIDNPGAPLLLGQSFLSKFGLISIDYSRDRITFN